MRPRVGPAEKKQEHYGRICNAVRSMLQARHLRVLHLEHLRVAVPDDAPLVLFANRH